MPSTTIETALIVIAVAVSIQAIVGVAVSIGSFLAMRRVQETLRTESAALQFKLDEALVHLRSAATSVSRFTAEAGGMANHAGRVIEDVTGAISAVASTVGGPKTMLVAGVAAGARSLLRRWGARRTTH